MNEDNEQEPGRYLYCLVDSGREKNLGELGIEGNQVYSITYQDIGAIVHDCMADPYDSDDRDEVKGWVRSHQEVLDEVMEDPDYASLVPAGFDTIIRPKSEKDVDTTVQSWLKTEYESIEEQLDRVENKEEYGVHVTYDPDWLSEKIPEDTEEVRSLKKKIDSKPEGAAYLYREKLEKLLSDRTEEEKGKMREEFIELIEPVVTDLEQEEEKSFSGQGETLMSLSCLVEKGKYQELGEVLEKIDKRDGLGVKFTGPWAPYSFTDLKNAKKGENF